MRLMKNRPSKTGAARVSVISNTSLVILKGVVGVLTGSVSILAEAIHSAVDLLAAVIAYLAVCFADRPPDETHAYGHGKLENVSGVVEALLILAAAVYIGYESVIRVIHGSELERLGLAASVMLLSAVVNYFVSGLLFRVSRDTDSIALEADGHHLRLDVYTCLGVFAGLAAARVTGLHVIDSLLGLAIAVWVGWIGVGLSARAIGPLMDRQLPLAELERIVSIIREEEDVLDFHKLRTRKSGAHRHVDVHLVVPSDMSLAEAHDLAEYIEDKIRAEFDNVFVLTHVEPEDESLPRQV